MNNTIKLNFLKRVLTDTVYDDEVMKAFFEKNEYPSAEQMTAICTKPVEARRKLGEDWPEKAHTMIGMHRLNNLHYCLDIVRTNNTEGDIIETGVWRGGSCIFIKKYLDIYQMNKKVFVADSFEGLPPPEITEDAGDLHHTIEVLKVPIETVTANFNLYKALDEKVVFLKGWFKDTLPNNNQIEKLCILRLDGDMYKSTMDVFDACYDKVVSKGFVIVDDYGTTKNNCQIATEDFRNKKDINKPFTRIDNSGIFWQKD
jgi:O-methyltransferase